MKLYLKRSCVFLISALALSLLTHNPIAFAGSLTKLQDEKKGIDQEMNELNTNIQRTESALGENELTTNLLIKQIDKLNIDETKTKEKISSIENQLNQVTSEIDHLYITLLDLESKLISRETILRERIRAIQAKDSTESFIDILLGAKSFTDLIDRYTSVSTLIEADRKIIELHADDNKQLVKTKNNVEQKLYEKKDNKQQLEILVEKLAEQRNEKSILIGQLKVEYKDLALEKGELLIAYNERENRSKEVINEILAIQKREKTIDNNKQSSIGSAKGTVLLTCSTEKEIDQTLFFAKFNSAGALSGKGQAFIDIAGEYGIDPVLMAAISIHETGTGTSNAVVNFNNPGGLMNPATNWSTLIRFDTLEAGLRSTAKTLDKLINKGGYKTVSELGSVYAPIGADNDPTGLNHHWVPNVKKVIDDFGGLTMNCSD